MYITAGLMNMLLKHFRTSQAEISGILAGLKYDYAILQNPTARIDANILGKYLDYMVAKTNNPRIGLETGFILPFVLTGIFFNIYYQSKTVREIFFEHDEPFDPAMNDLYAYTTTEDEDYFILTILPAPAFTQLFPSACRQWIEMQCGFFLQYAYSFTSRFIRPVLAYSPYEKEGETDRLEEYLGCPVIFDHDRLVLVFDRAVLDLPIVTGSKEILTIFEDYMNEIRIQETDRSNSLSQTIRRHLMHSLIHVDISLESMAEQLNMSKRNLQRKLKTEGTSYQKILAGLRMELSVKYLKEQIPLPEISYLLGFDSQSAFNKFFRKHFQTTPRQFN